MNMIKTVNLDEILPNPDNPRQLNETKFKLLVKSIKEFPEMMELREIVVDENMVILGGNMRYRAMQELGIKECVVKIAKGFTEEQKKEFIIKDNVAFGEWDYDLLANNFDEEKLVDWGTEILKFNTDELNLKDANFREEANKLSFSITFTFPESLKKKFSNFKKNDLEKVLIKFVNA